MLWPKWAWARQDRERNYVVCYESDKDNPNPAEDERATPEVDIFLEGQGVTH